MQTLMGTVLVTGATGRVGRGVVEELVRQGVRVRAATRRPGDMHDTWPAGVETVEFDYDRPETFRAAVRGIDRLFLVVRPGDDHSDETAIPLLDAALAGGVTHVVSLTAMGVDRLPGSSLRRIECHVEATAPSWTHLRPNFFMQIFAAPPLLGQLQRGNALRLPAGEARLSFIDAADISAAAAAVLTDDSHAGRGYTLTGPEALDHHEVARAIGAAAGRHVQYVPLEEGEARAEMAAGGLSAARVERLIGFYRLVRAGACAVMAPDLESILGRRPTTFEQFARRTAEAWGPSGGQRGRSSAHARF